MTKRTVSLGIAAAFIALVLFPAAVAATQAEVAVTITEFKVFEDPDPGDGENTGDIYFKVKIGNGDWQVSNPPWDDQEDFYPNWAVTGTVDLAQYGRAIPVYFQAFDSDDSYDDILDINTADNEVTLLKNYDPFTGEIKGTSLGDGDHEHFPGNEGGEQAQIWYSIRTTSDLDIDDDGIPDSIEVDGIFDENGNRVLDMAALGSDPCRKTIAIEIDYMAVPGPGGHSHQPQAAAIAEAVAMFDNAPVPAVANCPYPGSHKQTGVDLIVLIDDQLTEQTTFTCNDFIDPFKNLHFDAALRPYFHYSYWVHDSEPGSSQSGVDCRWERDFLVSLGSWANNVGTVRDQSGTLVHELGHALGLGHGGGDHINYKPNYLSVMNYLYDPGGMLNTATNTFELDYSDLALKSLEETGLREPAGIGDGTYQTGWADLQGRGRTGTGNGPLDWTWTDADGNGIGNDDTATARGKPIIVDLNADPCVVPGKDNLLQTSADRNDVVNWRGEISDGPDRICNTQAAAGTDDEQARPVGNGEVDILRGYDDWDNLKYRAMMSPTAGDGTGMDLPPHGEITFEEAQVVKAFWVAALSPDLKVEKTVDKTAALPGDTLTYTITVQNIGTGLATVITLVDTFPDGTSQIRTLADLPEGMSKDETFTATVPFPIDGGTVLVNSAAVTCTNIVRQPDDESNNQAQASTVVIRPDLQVNKEVDLADAIPGDTLTYTVTVTNTGSAKATGIVLVDTLPDGSTETRKLSDLDEGKSTTETFSYTVPFPIGDKTILTNEVTVTGTDMNGNPDEDESNNFAETSTVVHIPVLTLGKTATSSVNAGEAITYTLTYQNIGSGDAAVVTITDTLPRDVYYSLALDLGAGPEPSAVIPNADGTTTLAWTLGPLTGGSPVQTITYTARPSMLLLSGTTLSNQVVLVFRDGNGNTYPSLTASASTAITVVPPGKKPLSMGYYRNHEESWTAEILARIQATDTRYDGNADGKLDGAEIKGAFAPGGNQPKMLQMQLLACYFNLAERQINPDTGIKSAPSDKLGFTTVRAAVLYAMDTLTVPVTKESRQRYSDITDVLDQINNNKIEVY
jgi:uncharacterized repeat protein (TIGR01451 family)